MPRCIPISTLHYGNHRLLPPQSNQHSLKGREFEITEACVCGITKGGLIGGHQVLCSQIKALRVSKILDN